VSENEIPDTEPILVSEPVSDPVPASEPDTDPDDISVRVKSESQRSSSFDQQEFLQILGI
jgi:hypothetical protein